MFICSSSSPVLFNGFADALTCRLTRNVCCCGLLDSTAVPTPAGKPIQAQLRVLKKDEHGLRDKLIPAASWRVLNRLHDAGNHVATLTWEGI